MSETEQEGGGKPSPEDRASGDFSLCSAVASRPRVSEKKLNSVHLFTLSSLEEESVLQHACSLLEAKQ